MALNYFCIFAHIDIYKKSTTNMRKKILFIAAFMLTMFAGISQEMPDMSQMQLPLNPKVKSGVLPNGLSYYILHNEEPAGKANFYIAQKVGSTLEEPNQLGLAHFLEHMAFNGTTHFPGKNLLNYLQSKGIRFGADINAGTGFDQTVYNINNVPTSDVNLMDSVLLALRDWSCGISLEDDEIEYERGVILEEKRMTETANERMLTAILPVIYDVYPYQHTIIGTEDVIKNFTPEEIKDYYRKWYRPDQQGIIIVGDFDADLMEKKVVELFSTIEMPANAPERTYAATSNNENPIYAFYSDPEMQVIMTMICFKEDPIPFELRTALPIYTNVMMPQQIITRLINDRLEEFAQDPSCDYAYAGVSFGNYLVSKSTDAFTVTVIAKTSAQAAVADAMAIVARACNTGFTDSELERAEAALFANIEKAYNEKDKTSNSALGNELCRHFIDNEPTPGIELEYEIWQNVLPQIPLEFINELSTQILTSDNIVIVNAQPSADGIEVSTEDVMVKTVTDALNAQYEAYVDEVVSDPLVAQLPTPGSIKNVDQDLNLGTYTYTLSNNVKVIVKPTDFSADEIVMSAVKKGGKQIYSTDQADDVIVVSDVYENSKLGTFDKKMIKKYLAGKKVSLGFDIKNFSTLLDGKSTVKDLPTLMELIYVSFTDLNPDKEGYQNEMDRYKPMFANLEKSPDYNFQLACDSTEYMGNPFMLPPSLSTLENADYDKSFALLKEALSNPADYTFIFTGNIEEATFVPLMEAYLASLPTQAVKAIEVKTPIEMVKGNVENCFKFGMQTPATYVKNVYSGYNMPYNTKNNVMLLMLGQVLQNNYIETLREEEGGTYSPYAYASYNNALGCWVLESEVITNAEKQQVLMERAAAELENILNNGIDAVNFNKVKESDLNQYEIRRKNNSYWATYLMLEQLYPDLKWLSEYEEALNSVTLDDFNAFVKTLGADKNRLQVIMEGTLQQ